MKFLIALDLIPFEVPEKVYVHEVPGLRQDGMRPLKQFLLSELDDETLEKLCTEFRNEVFRKAGRPANVI